MNKLTIDQAIALGIKACGNGNVKEADRYFTAVLKEIPLHPEANHRMGLLTESVGQIEKALPFHQKALRTYKGNPDFWLSLIKNLIKLQRLGDAKLIIEMAESKGISVKDELRLPASFASVNATKICSFELKKFYSSERESILAAAARGWLYSINFDVRFISDEIIRENYTDCNEVEKRKSEKFIEYEDVIPKEKQLEILDYLINANSIEERFNRLVSLTYISDLPLWQDSFFERKTNTIRAMQQKLFTEDTLNVVIVGGGICGLFLAACLQKNLKRKIRILVLDNYSEKIGTRVPFSRDWLTHLPLKLFKKSLDSKLLSILAQFGTEGYVGLPLNLIETLLMIHCKHHNVFFNFDRQISVADLDHNSIDLVFDASGGRLGEFLEISGHDTNLVVSIKNKVLNFKKEGVRQLADVVGGVGTNIDFYLKRSGSYHYPFLNNRQIISYMIKLTNIPSHLHSQIFDFIRSNNDNNRFYLWSGKLVKEINKNLLILNLQYSDFIWLGKNINHKMRLKDFLGKVTVLASIESKTLLAAFNFLSARDDQASIIIERPFIFRPHVNLMPLNSRINGIDIFPLGDALYTGNPKMGNGLGLHLPFISKLADYISNDVTP